MESQEKKSGEPKKKVKKYRSFTVEPGLAGFKIKIGCSEAYFCNAEECKVAISEYLDDPQGAEERILSEDCRFDNGAIPQTNSYRETSGASVIHTDDQAASRQRPNRINPGHSPG